MCNAVCFPIEPPERRFVKEPEYASLQEIVDQARAAGQQVLALGPAGIIEIQPPWPAQVVPMAVGPEPRPDWPDPVPASPNPGPEPADHPRNIEFRDGKFYRW